MRTILSAAALSALALTHGAGAADLSQMTDAEREAFRAEVRAYLMENPEVIMEAVEVLEQRQQAAKAEMDQQLVRTNAEEIFNDGYSWVGGNPEGDITLVEFLDYRCGYCRRAHEEVLDLVETDGNIRYVVKELPILGPDSLLASQFTVATKQIAGEDAYHDVFDAMMTFEGKVNEAALRRLAGTFGLNADEIIAHMDSDAVAEEIAATRSLAGRLQINGTPTFILGNELIRGYVPQEQMEIIVADVRDQG